MLVRRNDIEPGGVTRVNLARNAVSGPAMGIEIVSTFPTNPNEGDEVYYRAAAGVIWHFRYDETSTTYPWCFVGGPELMAQDDTNITTTSTTFATPTGYLTLTVPLTGEYEVYHATRQGYTVGGPGTGSLVTTVYNNGSDTTLYVSMWQNAANLLITGGNKKLITCTAGQVVDQRHQTASGTTGTFGHRVLTLRPRRVA